MNTTSHLSNNITYKYTKKYLLLEHTIAHLTQHSFTHTDYKYTIYHTILASIQLLQRMENLLGNNMHMIYVWVPLCTNVAKLNTLLKVIFYANTNSISILLNVNGQNQECAADIIPIENEYNRVHFHTFHSFLFSFRRIVYINLCQPVDGIRARKKKIFFYLLTYLSLCFIYLPPN